MMKKEQKQLKNPLTTLYRSYKFPPVAPIIVPKAFTKKQCESIISYHSDWTEKIGSVGEEEEEKIEPNIRQCMTYIPPSKEDIPNWIQSEILKIISFVNRETYKFDLGKKEKFQLQLLRYDSEKGDHYGIHIDNGPWELASKRKISFTLLLNNSYEGGKLKFFGLEKESKSNPEAGDMIMFPSYLTHKVEPVTSGVRWVLVGWILGDKHYI